MCQVFVYYQLLEYFCRKSSYEDYYLFSRLLRSKRYNPLPTASKRAPAPMNAQTAINNFGRNGKLFIESKIRPTNKQNP